jgi:hypothetical protein
VRYGSHVIVCSPKPEKFGSRVYHSTVGIFRRNGATRETSETILFLLTQTSMIYPSMAATHGVTGYYTASRCEVRGNGSYIPLEVRAMH